MLKQRIITALILAPLTLAATFLLPLFEFKLFIAAVMTVAAWEWANLSGLKQPTQRVAYAAGVLAIIVAMKYLALPALPVVTLALLFWCVALGWVSTFPNSKGQWQSVMARSLMGLLVLIPTWSGLVELKAQPSGNAWLLLLMLLVWGADVGAYFAQQLAGGAGVWPGDVASGGSVGRFDAGLSGNSLGFGIRRSARKHAQASPRD